MCLISPLKMKFQGIFTAEQLEEFRRFGNECQKELDIDASKFNFERNNLKLNKLIYINKKKKI